MIIKRVLTSNTFLLFQNRLSHNSKYILPKEDTVIIHSQKRNLHYMISLNHKLSEDKYVFIFFTSSPPRPVSLQKL